jgi:hypothetical protein
LATMPPSLSRVRSSPTASMTVPGSSAPPTSSTASSRAPSRPICRSSCRRSSR